MSRLGSWFKAAAPKPSAAPSPAASQVDVTAHEIAMIEDAMASAALIMNDDIDGAEERLRKGDSTFHHLGQSLCIFMRSVLGFEKSIMVEASNRLNDCETMAWNDMKKAQKDAGGATPAPGRIYPPGSEYALILAEAQLMSAVVAVLHESLTEGIKGFYKLRKAFITLDGLMQAEEAYLKSRGLRTNGSKEGVRSLSEKQPDRPTDDGADDDSDLEFLDASEDRTAPKTPLTYEGHLSKDIDPEKKLAELSLNGNSKNASPNQPNLQSSGFRSGPDSDIFSNPVDIFIHSGTNMCFGILLLIISMVPPAFSRLLSIIGFRGDRERGVHMLWRSTEFNNINGGVAGLMLFAYYNGLLGFSDILPNDEDIGKGAIVGYPRERCANLLAKMRVLFPESGLWRLEEARMLSNKKDLHGAIKVLKSNAASKMRQVTALNSFELSLDSMYVQDYTEMRDSFLRCVELNDWSHALYYYLAGCAELENYRDAFHAGKDETTIRTHKKKAEDLFKKAPTVVGKKKFMARPLPFEQFVSRKLQKWQERAKALGVDLADAAGVSPAQEMTYLWNGTKKMGAADLERSTRILSWDRLTAPEKARASIRAETDERAVQDVCMAAVLRNLGKYDEAHKILQEVMAIDRALFKGGTKDDYPPAAAHYEMAVLAWIDVQNPGLREAAPASGTTPGGDSAGTGTPQSEEEWRRKKLDECQAWLDTLSRWEAFILDARFGMRINTGLDTIRWYRKEHGWATE
ncbi:hypothetical protein DL769_003174 [Monosporascus sp. CRB-8-3]|nr:hypothetical protein DL769_003174 [Monosporascus sp. CRB-8-3]